MKQVSKTGRVSTFKVCYSDERRLYYELVETTSAQKAVDHVRSHHPDLTIVEVSKVVYNWK